MLSVQDAQAITDEIRRLQSQVRERQLWLLKLAEFFSQHINQQNLLGPDFRWNMTDGHVLVEYKGVHRLRYVFSYDDYSQGPVKEFDPDPEWQRELDRVIAKIQAREQADREKLPDNEEELLGMLRSLRGKAQSLKI